MKNDDAMKQLGRNLAGLTADSDQHMAAMVQMLGRMSAAQVMALAAAIADSNNSLLSGLALLGLVKAIESMMGQRIET